MKTEEEFKKLNEELNCYIRLILISWIILASYLIQFY